MVLLALGILIVSLSFIAYRYKSYRLSSQPLKPSEIRHADKQKAPEPHTYCQGQGNSQPELTVTAPEAPGRGEEKSNVKAVANMKNPFEDEEGRGEQQTRNSMPPPSFKSIPNGKPASPAGLMPTPSRSIPKPTTALSPPKSTNTTPLRPAPSTASTLRTPPGRVLQTSSLLAPSISTLAPSSRPSKKVLLEPGHSPLDWAHLTKNPPSSTFLRGVDVPPALIRVPPSLLKYHNGRKDKETGKMKDAWGVRQGKVYNLSPYMKFHPGGVDQLMRGVGNMKAEQLFNETHSWVSWDNMMGECLIGILVSENEIQAENDLEEMD